MTVTYNGQFCRAVAASVLDVLVEQVRVHAVRGKVDVEVVEEIASALGRAGTQLGGFFGHSEAKCQRPQLGRISLERRVNLFGRVLCRPLESLWDDGLLGGDRRIVPRLLRAMDEWVAPGTAAAANADLAQLAAGSPEALAGHPDATVLLQAALGEFSRNVTTRGDSERLWRMLATNEAGEWDILRRRAEFNRVLAALMSPITGSW